MFGRKPMSEAITYALCERISATGTSPHHIRILSDVGMKKSGGADTLALCGTTVAWDTSILELSEVPRIIENSHRSFHLCHGCVEALPRTTEV